MKYYPVTHEDGRKEFVATQLEAKALGVKNPQPEEIPTDKDGLREYINKLLSKPVEQAPIATPAEPSVAQRILAQLDAPKQEAAIRTITMDEAIEYVLETDPISFGNVLLAAMEKVGRIQRSLAK